MNLDLRPMEMLTPGVLHAYAHARQTRDETGRWPTVRALARIAQDEEDCGSIFAVVALTRGELPLRAQPQDGYAWERDFAPVEQAGVELLVPDAETLRAVTLYGEERVHADLFTPGGKHLTPPLVPWAEQWEKSDDESFAREERRWEARNAAAR